MLNSKDAVCYNYTETRIDFILLVGVTWISGSSSLISGAVTGAGQVQRSSEECMWQVNAAQ